METTDFVFLKTFRIDFLTFDLFKNNSGGYKTVCKNKETGDEEKQEYESFDMLYSVFSDEFTKEELIG